MEIKIVKIKKWEVTKQIGESMETAYIGTWKRCLKFLYKHSTYILEGCAWKWKNGETEYHLTPITND